ncbi:hypothetical protein B0A50_01132 [Salinomyces thailandicus]|uniref:Stc1 domain-containing protein n=1 Tax=Salinomyces thailandicus TaxID=706561 RepID=A0A4U0UEA1_9PEZI|nr:hypothetical protein B0A50_01132 [Salinomyces thailandica]
MAPKMQVGFYGDGYSNAAVEKIPLPPKIKCVRCDKVKASTAFSKKQQSELKMKIHKDGAFNAVAIKYIVCIGCTGGQVVELECRMCGITKGLDKFSKNQRRARDNAKCWKCMEEQVNAEPAEPGAYDSEDSEESEISGNSDDDEDYDDDDCGTLAGTFAGTSLGGAPSSTAFPSSVSGGVRVDPSVPASTVSVPQTYGQGGVAWSSVVNAGLGKTAVPPHSMAGQRRAVSPSTSTASTVTNRASGAAIPPHLAASQRRAVSPSTSTTSTATSRAPSTVTNSPGPSRQPAPARQPANRFAFNYNAQGSDNSSNKFAKVKSVPQKVVFPESSKQEQKPPGSVSNLPVRQPAKAQGPEDEVDDEITVESESSSDSDPNHSD